jgi:hypothetical protein
MKLKVGALIATSLVPFLVAVLDNKGIYKLELDFKSYMGFNLLYGSAWLLLFAFVYDRAAGPQRRRLWLLSPLVLFAFAAPVAIFLLNLAFGWAMAHGAAPP